MADLFILLLFCPEWQVYVNLFSHPLLESFPLQVLVDFAGNVAQYFVAVFFLVALPNILPSIISPNKDSCLKMCPVHPSYRCCAVFKILLFSSTFWRTSTLLLCLTSRSFPFSAKPTFQRLPASLYQPS